MSKSLVESEYDPVEFTEEERSLPRSSKRPRSSKTTSYVKPLR